MRLETQKTTTSWWGRIKRIFMVGAIGAVIMGAGAGYVWRSAINDELQSLAINSGLILKKITIKGRVNTEKTAILTAVDSDWYQPIFSIDLARIHHNIENLGWVKAAEVKRILPSSLAITINERRALALYQDEVGHHVIDQTGQIIKGARPEDFTDLPVVTGHGAPQNTKAILEMLQKETTLFADVWSLTYQSNRRWDVYLRNNIRILLPEKNPEKAWTKLAKMSEKHGLTRRNLVNIDLRIPNKLVIRPVRAQNIKGNNT